MYDDGHYQQPSRSNSRLLLANQCFVEKFGLADCLAILVSPVFREFIANRRKGKSERAKRESNCGGRERKGVLETKLIPLRSVIGLDTSHHLNVTFLSATIPRQELPNIGHWPSSGIMTQFRIFRSFSTNRPSQPAAQTQKQSTFTDHNIFRI